MELVPMGSIYVNAGFETFYKCCKHWISRLVDAKRRNGVYMYRIHRAARAAGLKVTIHFAEAECSASEAELATILRWMPDRLGHVIHVPESVKREIAARPGIGLELCLSCNVKAKMIVGSFDAHHFGEWWRVDGPVVVPCTDDVGVFGSPVSNEWALIQEHFHLEKDEILSLARKGIDVIFGGDEQKARLRELMW
ncbi:hypothetical protein ONZ43_g1475 [Nemania bipapillata]|uniref:Uncharacterized protein n=1 Tax=Nemania bipapillata TaxID=110536 RepID=A0ACC2J499_9PEZI|nr:hypothetical protein ONZ43_g1475 [Nemania bipapillata]